MYGYVHAFLEQVMVSGACNWLLMMRDRSDEDELPITQNILAEMLGVQRPTITNAAEELERAGLIERGRRQLTILDRRALTKASCEDLAAGIEPYALGQRAASFLKYGNFDSAFVHRSTLPLGNRGAERGRAVEKRRRKC
jgi:DNA-binding transcriptional ArsR family regulator